MSLLKHVYRQFNNAVFYDCINIRGLSLHAQSEFGLHNASNNAFRRGFAAGEFINLSNHLAISLPFIFQVLGFIIVNVMSFGNPV